MPTSGGMTLDLDNQYCRTVSDVQPVAADLGDADGLVDHRAAFANRQGGVEVQPVLIAGSMICAAGNLKILDHAKLATHFGVDLEIYTSFDRS